MKHIPDSLFRQVTQINSRAIVFYDTDGTIIYLNDAANKLYGYTDAELLGKPATVTIAGDKDVKPIINEILLKGGWVGEILQKKKDGTEFPASLDISLITDEKKSPLFMASNHTDISGIKILGVEVKKLNSDLEQWMDQRTEKLKGAIEDLENRNLANVTAYRELESFSYSVSHDLKAPLRIITGYSQLLLKHSGLDEEEKRFVLQIEHNVNKMTDLVEALLTLAKQERKEINNVEIDVKELVESTISDLQKALPEYKSEFIVHEMPKVLSDYDLLQQVYVNLISNAMKYSSKKDNPVVEIGATQVDHESLYYVKDNGAGFDMKYAEKLFHAFQRLHNESEFPGTGVGLSIVQKIMNRLGGKVWVDAKVGEGATFYFKFIKPVVK